MARLKILDSLFPVFLASLEEVKFYFENIIKETRNSDVSVS